MNIGFIGAGKAGTSLGVYFRRHNIPVTGYASRTMESSKEAARVTESAVFSNINELVTDSDIIFITTSDGVIEEIAKELANLNLEGKMLCHVSGSVSSEVLKTASCKYGSAHPMMAINNRETDLSKAFFTIEGEDETADIFQKLKMLHPILLLMVVISSRQMSSSILIQKIPAWTVNYGLLTLLRAWSKMAMSMLRRQEVTG